MLMEEFLFWNVIIGIMVLVVFKTKNFATALLFAIITTLFVFKYVAFTGVSYSYEVVRANTTAYLNTSNYTITSYGYEYLKTFTIGAGELIFIYLSVFALVVLESLGLLFKGKGKFRRK